MTQDARTPGLLERLLNRSDDSSIDGYEVTDFQDMGDGRLMVESDYMEAGDKGAVYFPVDATLELISDGDFHVIDCNGDPWTISGTVSRPISLEDLS